MQVKDLPYNTTVVRCSGRVRHREKVHMQASEETSTRQCIRTRSQHIVVAYSRTVLLHSIV